MVRLALVISCPYPFPIRLTAPHKYLYDGMIVTPPFLETSRNFPLAITMYRKPIQTSIKSTPHSTHRSQSKNPLPFQGRARVRSNPHHQIQSMFQSAPLMVRLALLFSYLYPFLIRLTTPYRCSYNGMAFTLPSSGIDLILPKIPFPFREGPGLGPTLITKYNRCSNQRHSWQMVPSPRRNHPDRQQAYPHAQPLGFA